MVYQQKCTNQKLINHIQEGPVGDAVPHNIVSVKEVAEFLHITEETVYNLARERKIPAIKIGNQWRFDMDEIKKLFKDSKFDPGEKI